MSHSRLLLVAFLLLLAAPATAAPVSFEPPMSVEGGDADVGARGFLVAFRPETQWSLVVESDEVGQAIRHRYAHVDAGLRPTADVSAEPKVETAPVPSEWTRLRLASAGEVATLVVLAESVRAVVPEVSGRVSLLDDSPSDHWDDPWWSDAIRQPMQVADGPVPALEVARSPSSVSFSGLRSIEWTNVAVSCNGDCPESDDSGTFLDHIQQALGNGTATLTGAGDFVAFLGPLDLSFEGTARFPHAVGDLECPNCSVQDDTLTVHGAIELRGLTADGGAGLSTDMAGAYSVRVGEAPVGSVSGPAVATAVAAALAVGLVAKLLWALISKQILADPLVLETRRRVFEAIEASPGVTRAELLRATGIKNGQMVYHERVLVETGQVRKWKRGRASHYALPHVSRAEAMRDRLRGDPGLSELLSFVAGNGGSSQATVAQWALERFGWASSTVQDKLHQLLDVGLVHRVRQGKLALYSSPTP